MAEIARASGVADGTLYLYFKNKEALARAAMASFFAELTKSAHIGVENIRGALPRLEFLARHHLDQVTAHRRLLEMQPNIDLNVESYKGSELHALNRTYVSVFDRVVSDGIADGSLQTQTEPALLRDIFFGSLDYAARSIMLRGGSEAHFAPVIAALLPLFGNSAPPPPLENIARRLETVAERIESHFGDEQ